MKMEEIQPLFLLIYGISGISLLYSVHQKTVQYTLLHLGE